MKILSRIAATFVLSSLLIVVPASASNNTLSDEERRALLGPEFKYISSGETVPDEDKLVAALECDGGFEVAWLEKYGKGSALPTPDPKVAAVILAIETAGALSKTQHKERHMISCLAEKDMVQSSQAEGVWWPTRYSLK